MGDKHSGSHKTRSFSLGNPVVRRICAYCGEPCERKYCDVQCYRAKQRSQQPEIRFWAKVDKTDGCWLWTACRGGGRGQKKYGRFIARVDGAWKPVGAHVWAYEQAYGPVPDGLEVMHQCHNKLCVRPDHLKVGTRRENVQASAAEGHYNVPHKPKKLTDEQVLELRSLAASGEKGIRLAARFEISETLVSLIVSGRRRRQYDAPQKAS